MQRCFVLMRSARRFFTLQAKNLVCVYTGTHLEFQAPGLETRLSRPLLQQGSEVGAITKSMTHCQAGTLMGLVDAFRAAYRLA